MPDDARSLVSSGRQVSMFFDRDAFEFGQRVANMFANSQLVPQNLRGKQADCLIALDMARRMGEDPIMVMQNIFFVHGRAGWAAQYMIARANRSGIFRGPLRWSSSGTGPKLAVTCFAELKETEEGEDPRVEITVDMEMARADGWTSNEKYKSIPEQMLRWRSATWLIRLYCPEVMMGLPSLDELQDTAGGMIDATPPRPTLEENHLVDEHEQVEQTRRRGRPRKTVSASEEHPPGQPEEPEKEAPPEPEPASPADPEPPSPAHEEPPAAGEPGHVEPISVPGVDHPIDPTPEPEPPTTAATAHEPPTTAATTTNGTTSGYDVSVDASLESVQGWYQPARAKLKKMKDEGRPPEDFRRFREANKVTLGRMQDGFGWWYKNIDEEIRAGESRML